MILCGFFLHFRGGYTVIQTTGSSATVRPWSRSFCRFSQPSTVAVLWSALKDPSAFWQRVNLTDTEPELEA